MTSQIGVQLYTLREHCRNPADFAHTCQKLKRIGFVAVQVSAVGVDDPVQVKQILDDHGLSCVATHRNLDQLRDTERVLEEHQILQCGLTALSGFGSADTSEGQWREFIKDFRTLGQALGQRGLRVGYHNHSHELAPFGEDPARFNPRHTPLQLLLEQLQLPLWFEIDTYWIAHGGGDPAAWIDHCAGRLPALHVKDMTVNAGRQQKMCEVGLGNLNWPRILEACRHGGVEWYLIERDDGDLDPFESLRISLENLRCWGLE